MAKAAAALCVPHSVPVQGNGVRHGKASAILYNANCANNWEAEGEPFCLFA